MTNTNKSVLSLVFHFAVLYFTKLSKARWLSHIDPKIILLLGFELSNNLKTFQTNLFKEYLLILQRLVNDAKNLQILANSAKNLQRFASLQGYICGF